MRRILVLSLAACSVSSEPRARSHEQAATARTIGVSDAAAEGAPATRDAEPAPAVGMPVANGRPSTAPVRLWQARPGSRIVAVFATEDGSAVVSLDVHGHARLWPALDGSREPWSVPIAVARHVALRRDARGFVLAARDESGGIEIVAVSEDGELVSRAKLPADPGFDAVHATDSGFVALRRDQVIVALDARGGEIGTLAPPAGEHVIALLHRNARTLALVHRKEGLNGRWLATGPLAWGDATPALHVEPSRAFLSPDGAHVATFRRHELDPTLGETSIVELATGRSRTLRDEARLSGHEAPIGFSRDGLVVLAERDFDDNTVAWWTATGSYRASIGNDGNVLDFVDVRVATATDSAVIAVAGQELVVIRRETPRDIGYLGYRGQPATGLRATARGVVARAGGTMALLDEHARTTRKLPGLDAVPITDTLALVRFAAARHPDVAGATQTIELDPSWLRNQLQDSKPSRTERLVLYDLAARKALQHLPPGRAFHYEPSTQLVAIERGTQVELARFAASARSFDRPRAVRAAADRVALLDPALAAGHVVALARQRGAKAEVRLVRDVDTLLRDGGASLPAATVLAGKLEAIDRAGRSYIREDADTVAVYGHPAVDGAAPSDVRRIGGLAGWKVRPDPSGTLIAAFARKRLALFGADGVQRWIVALEQIRDVAWTHDGQLFAVGGDVVRLDVEDGSVRAAQCGWGFARRGGPDDAEDPPNKPTTPCDR